MTDPRAAFGTMPETLQQTTGRSLDEWLAIVRATGLEKHGQIVAALKQDHGLSHGYANMLALLSRGYGQQADDELLEGLFAGPRASLRPIYDRLLDQVRALGPDVEVATKKTMVSFRRSKQFACFTPTSAKRVDVGVAFRSGAPNSARIKATPGGMTSHVVRVESPEEIDDELSGWVRAAYDAN